jgi:acetate kinase
MIVVSVNAGSTSVKLAAFACERGELRELVRERRTTDGSEPQQILRAFAARVGRSPLTAIAHRVVHGGTRFVEPALLDASTEAALDELDALAPLHNPVARTWIAAARSIWPAADHVAVFDTAFFAGLPPCAARYAIPDALGKNAGVRRYGFHGLAHEAMWLRWCELEPALARGGRIITLQLGGGASIAAIDQGRPIDTSMGFTPLEGLVMGTRSGDIDPSVVPYLAARLGVRPEQVIDLLNRQSGLLGVSGHSAEIGELLREGSPASRLAVEMFCTRARKYVGAYLALLNGCDGIVFGGGIGEHVPEVRAAILRDMAWAGIVLDETSNAGSLSGEACISEPSSAARIRVVAVDEERLLAGAAARSVAWREPDPAR